jgi:hypothetical protein
MDVLLYIALMSAMASITTNENGMSTSIFIVSQERLGKAPLGTRLMVDQSAGACQSIGIFAEQRANRTVRVGRTGGVALICRPTRCPNSVYRALRWLEISSQCHVSPSPASGTIPGPAVAQTCVRHAELSSRARFGLSMISSRQFPQSTIMAFPAGSSRGVRETPVQPEESIA